MENERIVGIVFILFVVMLITINQNPFMSKEEKFEKNLERTRDLQYIKMIEDVAHSVESHINNITSSRNYGETELHGRMLKEDMQTHINNDQYLISPELRPIEIKFKEFLEDYHNVGKLIEIGIKNNDNNSINRASNYSKDAYNTMEDMSKLIEDYMKKNDVKKK